jgi:hypothetical protein
MNLFRKLKLKLDLNDLNMNKDYIIDAYYSRKNNRSLNYAIF